MKLDQKSKRKQRLAITYRRTQRRQAKTAHTAGLGSPVQAATRVPQNSKTTSLVFQAILGAAACLALVGVVVQSQNQPIESVPAGSPDAPPPAVFVQLD